MAEQLCTKCSPNQHYHLDHSYQSHVIEDDKGKEVVLHIYSCKICPCHTEKEGGDIEDFKKLLIEEVGIEVETKTTRTASG